MSQGGRGYFVLFAALEIEPLHMAGMHTFLCPMFDLGQLFKAQNSILESQIWRAFRGASLKTWLSSLLTLTAPDGHSVHPNPVLGVAGSTCL